MVSYQQINDFVTIAQSSVLKVNAVLIECNEYLCLIDTLLLPSDSKSLKQYINTKAKPLKYLINTHFHSDHSIGNKYLADDNTVIIAHQKYLQTYLDEREKISSVYKSSNKKSSIYKTNYHEIMHPNVCMKDQLIIDDELRFKLLETPGHTYDSICIYIKELKLLIAGDTLLGSPNGYMSLPYFLWGNETEYINSLDLLSKLDIETIITGHSDCAKKELIDDYLQYLNGLVFLKDKLLTKRDKFSIEELSNELRLDACYALDKDKKLWKPEIHQFNVEKIYHSYFADKIHNN
ncbi:MAG: MBL fold metallo-hydrolase [Candidatus Cloacimonadales bacterium]|jgi:glyoxylase-like metal-dependent hydrolase (beta-lactamase superfamily II)|nr:MBL fold metallo-hydrolase [Candidatus Cloacimonadota bacterium]MDD3501959.1 MBL fold metallo-hydrolase [Candidatus Cloacimonadota bacterium]MDX9977973.1 MBL fold metallo-hydrolase [Candidatus Cloacimonadales bacterium]